jgi:hypothetical protein
MVNSRAVLKGPAHSSSGLGHRPLKAETRGSNPLCATNSSNFRREPEKPAFVRGLFLFSVRRIRLNPACFGASRDHGVTIVPHRLGGTRPLLVGGPCIIFLAIAEVKHPTDSCLESGHYASHPAPEPWGHFTWSHPRRRSRRSPAPGSSVERPSPNSLTTRSSPSPKERKTETIIATAAARTSAFIFTGHNLSPSSL